MQYLNLILLLLLLSDCSNSKQPVAKADRSITKLDSLTESRENPASEDLAYEYVEQQPSFPGGEAELLGYLAKNVHFREDCIESDLQGRIHVEFIVERNGDLSNIEMTKGSSCYKKEVEEVFSNMPKWLPGIQDGKKVRVRYSLPWMVCFKG